MPTSGLSDFSVLCWTSDGTPISIGNFVDVTTTLNNEQDENEVRVINPIDYTCTMRISNGFRKTILGIVYGWKAKGPIRVRVLQKLFREYGRERYHETDRR